MSILSHPRFHDEQAAFDYVEAALWPQGPVCPHCGCTGRISAIKPNVAKRVRIGLKFCGDCRKQFTVRVGTIFEESKLPMTKWLQAIFLMCSSKKGVSAHQLHRTLETTYKTAWFLAHRIREAMKAGDFPFMGPGGGVIEADETFYGRNPDGPLTRQPSTQMNRIVSLVERGGVARSFVVSDFTRRTIDSLLRFHVSPDAHLMTDEAHHYTTIGKTFASHEAVNHGKDEYVRDGDPLITTNTVEGFFGLFKRGMKGVYQHCAAKHLHRYVAEFDFRYSNRIALGVDDQERASIALDGFRGRRLTYRGPSGRQSTTDHGPQATASWDGWHSL